MLRAMAVCAGACRLSYRSPRQENGVPDGCRPPDAPPNELSRRYGSRITKEVPHALNEVNGARRKVTGKARVKMRVCKRGYGVTENHTDVLLPGVDCPPRFAV